MDIQKDRSQFFHKRKTFTADVQIKKHRISRATSNSDNFNSQSKKTTIPEPFFFMTEIRSCIRLLKKEDEVENLDRPMFKARKIPKSLFDHIECKKIEQKLENKVLNTPKDPSQNNEILKINFESEINSDSSQPAFDYNHSESVVNLEKEKLCESDYDFVGPLNKSEKQEKIGVKIDFNDLHGWNSKYEQFTKEFFSKLNSLETIAYSENFDKK